ncbi:holo-ACP synthase [Oceanobacillus rekensis]|uniref:holo-ACP synthase n=1 Tax=Oceanobacillus rekensis TaxID=937927 RepID=UPI000B44F9FA|nr:holo-ACP synthase [Oceanobacillus rekensis]
MIKGIGMDLIELSRIQDSMDRNKRFAKRILTASEMQACEQLPTYKRRIEYIAGRFAAKEAFAKAVGTGIGRLSFQDIEVLNRANGAPFLNAKGYEQSHIFVSITHSRDYAAAQVVLEN